MLDRLVLAALLVLPLWSAAAGTLGPDEINAARHAPQTRAALAALPSGDTDAYAAALDTLASAPALDAVQREAALYAALLHMARLPPSREARAVLERYADRPVSLRLRIDHGHGPREIPAFDVAAAARYVLREWRIADARAVVTQRMKRGQTIATKAQPGDDDDLRATALARAMASATPAELRAQRPALLTGLPADPTLGAAAVVVARRLADGELLAAISTYGDDDDARAALREAVELIDPRARHAVVDAALARPSLASAAVFALGNMAAFEPQARARLHALLADSDRGGSAAAALARLDDPRDARDIAARLAVETNARTAARLALALSLMTNDTARRALRTFVESGVAHADLRASLAEHVQ